MLLTKSAGLHPGKSVRPTLLSNNTSPPITQPCWCSTKTTWPGAWPGVNKTSNSDGPQRMRSSAARNGPNSGGGSMRTPYTDAALGACSYVDRSRKCTRGFKPHRSKTHPVPITWSKCACVSRHCVGTTPIASQNFANSSCSILVDIPGSNTVASPFPWSRR